MFLSTAIALAFVGVSYAAWADDIAMSGTIYTGTVDIGWSEYGVVAPPYSTIVTSITGDTLYITIYNAYPCVDYVINFDIHCIGSVPVHFPSDFAFTADYPGTIAITPYPGYNPIYWTSTILTQGASWYGTLTIHLAEDAVQGGTYHFTATITGQQYNI